MNIKLIIAVVLGAMVGGAMGRDGMAVIGALLGWLVVVVVQQGARLKALEAAQRAAPAVPTAAVERASEAPAAPLPESAALAQAPLAEPMPVPVVAVTMDAEPEWAEPPRPPGPDRLAPLRAWLFGGNTIVKAGVAILFLGLAFLAKYATEHTHVPVEVRLMAVGAVALVLLAIGWRLRERRAGYAQVLQGGGVAVLYLTLFVAFRFYQVFGVGPAFVAMVAVAALAAALAVLQDAMALAVIGALGGFASPLLVSSGSGDHVGLFSYYLVLDLGILAVAWFRTWRVLNVVGFVCTFVIASAWGVLSYRPENYASSQFFLIAYFLLFALVLVLPARRGAADGSGDGVRDGVRDGQQAKWVNGSLLFGLPTVAFALQYGLVRHTEYGVALSSLVFAAFYVVLALLARKRPALALVFEASLAIGTLFLTLVIPFALDARSTAGAWSLEGAGLVWLGLRQGRRLPRALGYTLLVGAGLSMLVGHIFRPSAASLWNATLFNALLSATGSLIAARVVNRRVDVASRERLAEGLLIGWATLWLLSAAGYEIDGFVGAPYDVTAWTAVFSAIALLYAGLARRFDWRAVSWPAAAHAPLLGLCLLASAASQPSPWTAGGFWAWPLALAVHGAVLVFAAPHWPQSARRFSHALGVLLLAGLAALAGRAITGGWGDDDANAWRWLGWLVGPAALLLALTRAGIVQRWPLRLEPPAYTQAAAGVLSLLLLFWVLAANTQSDGSAQPLPYLPLINPLDLGIALALFAAAAWWRLPQAAFARTQQPMAGAVLLAGIAFLWLSGMLVRAFHHWRGVPYQFDAWSGSLEVQTGLTLLWSAIALATMWVAAKRALRPAWLAGAVLLGVVVLKLLLIDLSGNGTVTRIVSCIGVGVLMLVIGYVAPLPTAAKKVEQSHAA